MRMNLRSRGGYSLLELLVAATAAVLVGTGITVGLVNFSQRNIRETNVDQEQINLRRALHYIGEDFKSNVYVYPTALLPNRVPTFSDGGAVVPVLGFWQQNPVTNRFEQVVYYSMSPPAGSSLFGPRLVSRLVVTFDAASNPDADNNRFLSSTEAEASVPTSCTVAAAVVCTVSPFGTPPASLSVFNSQALVDRLSTDGAMTAAVISNTVLLTMTADSNDLAGNSLLSDIEKGQLRQQLSTSMRNR